MKANSRRITLAAVVLLALFAILLAVCISEALSILVKTIALFAILILDCIVVYALMERVKVAVAEKKTDKDESILTG